MRSQESARVRESPRESTCDHKSPRESTRVRESPQESTRDHKSPRAITRVHASPRESARVRTRSQESARVRESPRESTRVHESPRESARVHASPRESARVRESPRESARVHKSPRESARVRESPRESKESTRDPQKQCHALNDDLYIFYINSNVNMSRRLVDLDSIAFVGSGFSKDALNKRVIQLNSQSGVHWFGNATTCAMLSPDVLDVIGKSGLHAVGNEAEAADVALIEFAKRNGKNWDSVEVVTNDRAMMRVFALAFQKQTTFLSFSDSLRRVDPPPLFTFRNSFEIDKFITMVEKMPWLLKWAHSNPSTTVKKSTRSRKKTPTRSGPRR